MSCQLNFLCDVTLKAKQKRARELAAAGYKPIAIADIVGANLRSVQRWLAKDRSSAAINEPVTATVVDSLSESALEQNRDLLEQLIPLDVQTAIMSRIPDPPGWVQERESILEENQKYHQGVSRKLAVILDTYLDSSEINIRGIDRLSQCITRHKNAALVCLDHRWSDMNKALHLLSSHGFSVVDINQVLEERAKEKANLASPLHPLVDDPV